MEPTTSNTSIYTTVATALIFVAIGGALVYWGAPIVRGWAEKSASDARRAEFQDINETVAMQFEGDFAGSAQRAEGMRGEIGTGTVNYQRNITALATAEFWSGEKEKRLEAVRLTKEQLASAPGSKRNQALLINRLIGYMTTAMEPEIIAEVFKGEPFQTLYDAKNDTDSIFSNLALESISRYPTTAANARVGIWHSGKIFKDYDGIAELSKQEKVEHIQGILYRIEEMNRLFPSERKIPMLYSQLAEAQFAYYQGFMYGALSLTNPEYLDDMEGAFSKVHEEYRVERNDEGKPVALLESRIPYTNFAYATYLNAVAGSTRKADVEKLLAQVIELVTEHPDIHKGAFLSFMKQTAVDGSEGTSGRWYSYDRFVRMAKIYPPFKTFLNQNGWNLK